VNTAIAPPACIVAGNGLHVDKSVRCADCTHYHCRLCGRCARCNQNAQPGALRQRPSPWTVTPCLTR
jgi:hypothetical protein